MKPGLLKNSPRYQHALVRWYLLSTCWWHGTHTAGCTEQPSMSATNRNRRRSQVCRYGSTETRKVKIFTRALQQFCFSFSRKKILQRGPIYCHLGPYFWATCAVKILVISANSRGHLEARVGTSLRPRNLPRPSRVEGGAVVQRVERWTCDQ